MEYCLETQALCKTYGRFRAVDNLSMHVPRGAIYGFVGKNGAGKTTLLRLICGLQRPTAGGYCLYGVPHTDKALCTVRRRMGADIDAACALAINGTPVFCAVRMARASSASPSSSQINTSGESERVAISMPFARG